MTWVTKKQLRARLERCSQAYTGAVAAHQDTERKLLGQLKAAEEHTRGVMAADDAAVESLKQEIRRRDREVNQLEDRLRAEINFKTARDETVAMQLAAKDGVIAILQEQIRSLLEMLRTKTATLANPFEGMQAGLAAIDEPETAQETDGLSQRLDQYTDPYYMPPWVKNRIAADEQAALLVPTTEEADLMAAES